MSYKDMEEYETSNTRNSNTSKIKENKNKETEEPDLQITSSPVKISSTVSPDYMAWHTSGSSNKTNSQTIMC